MTCFGRVSLIEAGQGNLSGTALGRAMVRSFVVVSCSWSQDRLTVDDIEFSWVWRWLRRGLGWGDAAARRTVR